MSEQRETRLNLSAGLLSVGVASLLVLAKLWALKETASLSIAATLAATLAALAAADRHAPLVIVGVEYEIERHLECLGDFETVERERRDFERRIDYADHRHDAEAG